MIEIIHRTSRAACAGKGAVPAVGCEVKVDGGAYRDSLQRSSARCLKTRISFWSMCTFPIREKFKIQTCLSLQ